MRFIFLLCTFLLYGTTGMWAQERHPLPKATGSGTANDPYVVTLGNGEYQTGTDFDNKYVEIIGQGNNNTTLWYGSTSGYSSGGEGGSEYTFEEAHVTFKDVALKDVNGDKAGYDGFVRCNSLQFEGCTLTSMLIYLGSGPVTFKNCTFNHPDGYTAWLYGSQSYEFDGCTFNVSNRVFNVYAESAITPNIVMNNCTISGTASNKAVFAIKGTANGCTININNSTCTGLLCADADAAVNGGVWYQMEGIHDKNNVVLDGVAINVNGVAQTITEEKIPAVATTDAAVAIEKDETATEEETTTVEAAVNAVVENTATVNAATEIAAEAVPGVSSTKNYLHIDVKTAEVAKNDEQAYVKSMTFDVKPIAATITDGKLSTEVIPNSAIKSAITFRLPVDANATETMAEVFHNGESMGANYQVQGTTEKYIEVSTTSFSEFGYQLLNAPAGPAGVAQIGETQYESLQAAITAANANDEIILIADQEISSAIEISKNLTLNLNGKTIINNVASNRLFRVGGVTFTIDGTVEGSSMIIPETNKYSFGFVDMRNMSGVASSDAKLVLNGGYYEGATLGGAFFKGRNHYQTFELNDVHCKCTAGDGQQYYANGYYYNGDNASVVNSYGYLTTLKVVGGLYEHATLAISASNVFQGTNFMTDDKSSVSFDDVKVVSSHGPIYELSSGEMTINNCDFTINGAAIWQNSALCASHNAVLNVYGGKYNAPYAVYALTSGATININGGEFTGSESILVAGTDNYYENAVSTINVSDGTFTYTGSNPSNAYKTHGNRPTNIAISGGSFTEVVPAEYCALGFAPVTTTNSEGMYEVQELDLTLKIYTGNGSSSDMKIAAFVAHQKTQPNAMAVVSKENADYVAGLTNVIIDYPAGKNGHYYECENFVLTDLKDWYSPVEFTAISGSYSRNVMSGWNTVCMPFEVNTGNAGEIITYSGFNMDHQQFVFINQDKVQPGVACLVNFNSAGTWNVNFNNTKITNTINSTNGLVGSYNQHNIAEGYYKLNDEGKYAETSSAAKVYQFRNYLNLGGMEFDLGSGSTDSNGFGFIVVDEDDLTGMNNATVNITDGLYRNLFGQKVENPIKGEIYILNGAKVKY